MRSALLCASSAEKIFLFAAPKRLRAFRSCFFTGGVVEGNGSCRACFLREQPRGGHPLSLLTAFAARFPFLSPAVTSSPGAGEVFPLRGSQAITFVAKVLGAMRKLPAVLLALPLGELSPKVTERAHAVALSAKVSIATRNFAAMPKAPPSGELARRQA